MGVLFENSIVCHVFYAMASWAARVLCGLGGCFVLVCLALWIFVFGGLGWALVWFSGLYVLTVALAWLHALLCGVGWGLFVGFVWRV